ncbi:MAG: hypothetical protein LBV72_12095 [Tannerella sp.]|jgi:hypothetical protein|nr:hypothetical protein [Tannerella sp.]
MEIDIRIIVALVGCLGAIIGGIFTAICNYILNKKLDSVKKIQEKQKEVYLKFLRVYQDFKNAEHPGDKFPQFQHEFNSVCLYGDNDTSKAVKELYDYLINSMLVKKPLNEAQLSEYEKNMINSMRRCFGLDEFDSFYMDRFII